MNDFTDIQARLNYTFNAPILLRKAMTHASYVNEEGLKADESNERLEFLGDAVLEVCVSDLLYHRYPSLPEGKLTQRRAGLVCEPSLAKLARELNIGSTLLMGAGASQSGGRELDSILSDAMEALLGAIYLDGGYSAVRELIHRLMAPIVDTISAPPKDYKSVLQEILQKNTKETAVYTIVEANGPSHSKVFVAEVSHQGKVLGMGRGHSKKDAEQNAAHEALTAMKAASNTNYK
ncbi:MAG: ribonuclease III [Defluviitaleaceae bacterium]|nr:ribonuclease III [Defluviitaleaceae bacterium]